jgi:hypothetical protein
VCITGLLLASSRHPTRVCVRTSARFTASRIDVARSWTGPSAPVLGARGVLAVPCPPMGAAQVSVVRVGVAVRQVVEGSG